MLASLKPGEVSGRSWIMRRTKRNNLLFFSVASPSSSFSASTTKFSENHQWPSSPALGGNSQVISTHLSEWTPWSQQQFTTRQKKMTRTTTTIIYDNNNDNQQEHNLVPSEWTPAARCLRPELVPPPTHLASKEEQIDFRQGWKKQFK